jgi:DNA polymerase III epsilon subunit-like protein
LNIDRRRKYIAVVDTETANSLEEPLVYDLGWAIVDKRGRVYVSRSYLIKEVFCDERGIMQSAYYKDKIPDYLEDIQAGTRKIITFRMARKIFLDDCKRFNCNTACAHNARFDLNALNTTQRFLTKSKYRYFFPYGMEIWDTMRMAQDVVCPMPTYKRFCEVHEGYTLKNGNPRKTAEILYRFIINDDTFTESHTGLEDVLIEKEILAYCIRQHKKMRKGISEKDFPGQNIPIPEEERINRYIIELWGE